MAVSAAIIAVTAIGATAYSASASNSAAKKANSQAQDQARAQQNLEKEFTSATQTQETPAKQAEVAGEAQKAQKKKAVAASGRRDTILTSPLGLTGEAPGGQKTLLGQ